MLTTAAKVYGSGLIVAGLLGFVPVVTFNDLLFGKIQVNAVHNILHLLTGALVILTGVENERSSRNFLLGAGIAYGLFSCFGFVRETAPALGIATAYLHLGIAALSVYLGTSPESEASSSARARVPN